MSDPQITLEENGNKGRYVLTRHGHVAVLTYSRPGATQVIADPTEAPTALSGTGAGLALVTRLVQDARDQDFNIVPLSPFVNAMRRRHPEWADAFNVCSCLTILLPEIPRREFEGGSASLIQKKSNAGAACPFVSDHPMSQFIAAKTQPSEISSGGVRHRPLAT